MRVVCREVDESVISSARKVGLFVVACRVDSDLIMMRLWCRKIRRTISACSFSSIQSWSSANRPPCTVVGCRLTELLLFLHMFLLFFVCSALLVLLPTGQVKAVYMEYGRLKR